MEFKFGNNNVKTTKNRIKVLEIINKSDLPISAEEIYKECIKDSDVNLSTIYRALNAMVESNILIKQVRQDGVAYYQENSHNHKHLLICEKCNQNITLDICPLEKLLKNIANETGFLITSHNIELYGICENCRVNS